MTEKPDGKPRKRVGRWLAVLPLGAVCWFVVRSCDYGLPNVFFRDHHFKNDGQLTEEVAVDLTRTTLEAEGFDVSSMKPQRFWPDDPRVFARNAINPNNGYVSWHDPNAATWGYSMTVTIQTNGADVCCRVYRPK
ncbi:MAG TPA: hypothetical protein VGP63_29170 [Planctomycetaceae bacterium]|jgi:hypothetical protein|nr:hypothetical protein [Planctomycetaceae bacterium]